MDARRIPVIYQEYVVAPNLERNALLDVLHARCARQATVLYPGSSVHVTPSFFFQHVVYVDRSELSRDFFAQSRAIVALVNAHKRYRKQPFIRFVERDFTMPLPLPEGSFDLLLALYAGGISRVCARYVKPGGLLLTNNHHGDAEDAAKLPGFKLEALAQKRRGKLLFENADLERCVRVVGSDGPPHRGRPEATYYLFRRLHQGCKRPGAHR